MANITIKRNTGGAYENLYPRTIISQLFDTNGTTALFDGGKLKAAYLPNFVFGGMKMAGVVDLSAGTTEGNAIGLATLFGSIVNYANYATTADQSIGTYFVVNAAGFVTKTSGSLGSVAYHEFRAFVGTGSPYYSADLGEEADNTPPIYLERGDWIVLNGKTSPVSGALYYTYSVINNTYADATSTTKGVVTLSQTDTTQDSSDAVITEAVLSGLMGTGSGDIATGDHTHSGVYQPVDGDLTALSALSGTGFVKRTGADTYTLDTATYLSSQSTDFKTVTVTDTDTGYTWAATGSAVADATGDTVTLVSGTDINVDVDATNDAIRISHADTSSLSGAYGSAGISSITVDGEGHITAISSATYNNYSLPLAANGTRGGIQIGYTSTETQRALELSSEKGFVTLPRQIPAVTLNGASSTAPSFYAPTGAGLTGSTTQTKQRLNAVTGAEPTWIDSPNIYYDTTTGATLGDIILDVE